MRSVERVRLVGNEHRYLLCENEKAPKDFSKGATGVKLAGLGFCLPSSLAIFEARQ